MLKRLKSMMKKQSKRNVNPSELVYEETKKERQHYKEQQKKFKGLRLANRMKVVKAIGSNSLKAGFSSLRRLTH